MKFVSQLRQAMETPGISASHFKWLVRDQADDDLEAHLTASSEDNSRSVFLRRKPSETTMRQVMKAGGAQVDNGVTGVAVYRVGSTWPRLGCEIVAVTAPNEREFLSVLTDAIRKRDGEETIEKLLAKVDKRIRKLRVIPTANGNEAMLDLGLSEMVPLSQAGQGVARLVNIFAHLIGRSPKICIIDEVENGIHHSLLPEVWRGLAEAAEELGLQIFATTHSHECIEAAHESMAQRPDYGLSIIQLFRVEEGVRGRVLGRDQIQAAMDGEIDLRQ